MIPRLSGIDHIHVYVPDREEAAQWFAQVLGFRVMEGLRIWAKDGGPLTIADESGSIHLALFARRNASPSTAIAFGTDAKNFMQWKLHLETRGILQRCTDHQLAWSLYFSDPYQNSFEITTYEHQDVSRLMQN